MFSNIMRHTPFYPTELFTEEAISLVAGADHGVENNANANAVAYALTFANAHANAYAHANASAYAMDDDELIHMRWDSFAF